MRTFLLTCLFILLHLGGIAQQQQQQQDSTRKLRMPPGYTEQLDIIYTEVQGWQGKMDIYRPTNFPDKRPLLINIHGGGWNHGTRQQVTGGLSAFMKKGYIIATISYRLTPVATAPAAVEDVRCALLYLLNRANDWNIDRSKIVLMGSSAGAHLALMCGLLSNNHLFDRDCAAGQEVKIAAIVDRFGITDVWDWAHGPHKTSPSARKWLGKYSDDEQFAKSVSPITYVNKTSPPTIIIHGDSDPVVPIEHSISLYEKLTANGVKAEFTRVPGGLHGNFTKEQGEYVSQSIMNFLKQLHLHE